MLGQHGCLARDTKTIRIGQMVTCNGYRDPALLAKMASTVDVLSHGRLDFGIGAVGMSMNIRHTGTTIPMRLSDCATCGKALQVILAMWTQEEAASSRANTTMSRETNQPKGVQKPHIPILIGGSGEKVTLKLVAQYGNACNVGGDIERLNISLT